MNFTVYQNWKNNIQKLNGKPIPKSGLIVLFIFPKRKNNKDIRRRKRLYYKVVYPFYNIF